nr:2-C-methyl-D-erythritol 4-phosphate cytidylyltransferase [Candidatus Eremiobacteraeota bacterium]
LLERTGFDVLVVPGSHENFKVTVPDDLLRAERLLQGRVPVRSSEQEILLVEVFVPEDLVDAVCREIEERGGSVDAIDRDLPSNVAIRAYIPSEKLPGLGERFEVISAGKALYTTHFSHLADRSSHESYAGSRL